MNFLRRNFCMKRSNYFVFLFAVILLAMMKGGCSKFAFRKIDGGQQANKLNWPQAGGGVERASYRPYSMALPLEEKKRFKMSSALGQNIVASNGYLFAPTLDGRLAAINLQQMRIKVRKKLPQAHEAACAVADTSMVLARRFGVNTLLHYNLRTGKLLWDVNAGDIATEPLIADTVIYCAALYNHVDAYRRSDGLRLWQYRTAAQLHSSPALAHGVLAVGMDNGSLLGLDATTGSKKWEFDPNSNDEEKRQSAPFTGGIQATPIISGKTVFIGTIGEEFIAVDLLTGVERWRIPAGGKVIHAAASTGTLVIFGANDGRIRAVDAETGALQWEFRAGSVIGTSPVIMGHQVYFGALDHTLYCLELRNGAVLWQYTLEGRIRTNPIVWENYLITACEDNLLYIFASADSNVALR
jgi:outer membrane protein assembly factor BamB